MINHLWQSTLFAACAGLLILLLRGNRARVRYWVWLAASLKFFVPFSVLMDLGGRLTPAPVSEVAIAMEQIVQPFAEVDVVPMTSGAVDWVPAFLFALWFCGFGGIVVVRLRGWLRIRDAVRCSVPVNLGVAVAVRSSAGLLEPGVVGFFQPMLLLPAGIEKRLNAAQLDAVIAHELCHVSCRDNLTSAIHMLIEAVFWFHPLVWWIGARLVEERELACDESVLGQGIDPRVYAEGILGVCRYYVESPLACAAGVTGSNLQKRMEAIMADRRAAPMGWVKKVVLAAACIAAFAVPVFVGMIPALPLVAQSTSSIPDLQPMRLPPPPAPIAPPSWAATPSEGAPNHFEVVSVKVNKSGLLSGRYLPGPGKLTVTNATLEQLICWAYRLKDYQIVGGPGWLRSERYDITAKAYGAPDWGSLLALLQPVLAERFQLVFHKETRQVPVLALKVELKGPKMKVSPDSGEPQWNGRTGSGRSSITARRVKVAQLVRSLSGSLGRPVIDQTGLTGVYDFTLEWLPDDAQMRRLMNIDMAMAPSGVESTLFTALKEQLGLRLESARGPGEVIVIDSASRVPTEN